MYVWLGWWPEEKNKLLREASATTGSAHARWLRDKKLALQTAQSYIKGMIYSIGLKHTRHYESLQIILCNIAMSLYKFTSKVPILAMLCFC